MLVNLAERIAVATEQCEMPVDGLDGPKLGIGNEAPLGLTISWRGRTYRKTSA